MYDLRTNKHFTLKQNAIKRSDFDEFVDLPTSQAQSTSGRQPGQLRPDGRWRCFEYEDLLKRDKLSLDLFWIKGRKLEDGASLPIRMCWRRRSWRTYRMRSNSSRGSPSRCRTGTPQVKYADCRASVEFSAEP